MLERAVLSWPRSPFATIDAPVSAGRLHNNRHTERLMNLSFRSFTGAGLLLSTAIATASPIVLDTEQKAASAFETTLFKADMPRSVTGHVDDVLFFADFMLRKVNAATTPAALLGTPAGMTIPCSTSGSFKASMPDVQPRVLRLRFTECKTRVLGSIEGT